MKYTSLFLNYGNIFGLILMVLGFFLTPFFVGIPIFIIGILLLVFNFHKKWIDIFIPKNTQEKIGNEIRKSYEPYQPAISSMKSVGKEAVKTSVLVFVILIILILIVLRRYLVY